MPLRYGSELAEHHAVRRAAGLFDLSHMGEIEVAGPQAAAFLDHALVSDLGALEPYQAKYTMICRRDGGILDDLIVYRLDRSALPGRRQRGQRRRRADRVAGAGRRASTSRSPTAVTTGP